MNPPGEDTFYQTVAYLKERSLELSRYEPGLRAALRESFLMVFRSIERVVNSADTSVNGLSSDAYRSLLLIKELSDRIEAVGGAIDAYSRDSRVRLFLVEKNIQGPAFLPNDQDTVDASNAAYAIRGRTADAVLQAETNYNRCIHGLREVRSLGASYGSIFNQYDPINLDTDSPAFGDVNELNANLTFAADYSIRANELFISIYEISENSAQQLLTVRQLFRDIIQVANNMGLAIP